MFKLTIHKFATLTIALAAFSLSACSMFGGDVTDPLEDLREQVLSTVHDQERADAMLVSLGRLDQLLIESAELMAEAAGQERILFADYDSTPQDFEALFTETSRKRQDLQEAMLDVHLEFKAQATAEEWATILPLHANAVSMRVQSLVVAATNERR